MVTNRNGGRLTNETRWCLAATQRRTMGKVTGSKKAKTTTKKAPVYLHGVKVIPFQPLRGLKYRVHMGDPDQKADMRRMIVHLGGTVVNSNVEAVRGLGGYIIVDDPSDLPASVESLMNEHTPYFDQLLEADDTRTEFKRWMKKACKVASGKQRGVLIKHRNRMFILPKSKFPVLGKSLLPGARDVVADMMAIQYDRRRTLHDDELTRVQLCSVAGDTRTWTVQVWRTTMHNACIDKPRSLMEYEFKTEESARESLATWVSEEFDLHYATVAALYREGKRLFPTEKGQEDGHGDGGGGCGVALLAAKFA